MNDSSVTDSLIDESITEDVPNADDESNSNEFDEDLSKLIGVWNIYAGGFRDGAGNWLDVWVYTINFDKNGEVELAAGIVNGERNEVYSGTWSGNSIEKNLYQVSLKLTNGMAATGETPGQENYSVVVKAMVKENSLIFEKVSGDDVCLAYEKDLSFNAWKESQKKDVSYKMPDNSYLGDWLCKSKKSAWDRKITITKIEDNKIFFDLHYHPQTIFWSQSATITQDKTATFTAKNNFFL